MSKPSPPNPSRHRWGKQPRRDEGSSAKNPPVPHRPTSASRRTMTAPATAAAQAPRQKQTSTLPHRPTSTPAQPGTPPRQSQPKKPVCPRDDWRDRSELNIRVQDLPTEITPQILYSNFSSQGNIVRIDVFDADENKAKAAKIFFEPPPKHSFWKSPYNLKHPEQRKYPDGCNVNLSLMGRRRDPRLKVSIKLKKLEFGTMRPQDRLPERREASVSVDGTISWVLPLSRPPSYFWKVDDVLSTFSPDDTSWNEKKTWYRATNIVSYLDAPMTYSVAVHDNIDDPEYIDIGSWTTFRFVLPDQAPRKDSDTRLALLQELNKVNVAVVHTNEFDFWPAGKTMWDYLDHPAVTEGRASALLDMAASPVIHIPFEVRYQLEVCVSRGILNEHTVTPEFLQTLAALRPIDAVRRLEYLADQKEQVFDPVQAFLDSDAASYIPNPKLPHYCTLGRKAVVTPTSIRYSSPTVETSNRVVRKYNHMQDRFLRVQFLEEEEQGRICFNKPENDEIWKRMLRTLFRGIRIGDRVYEFLGFGNSQLRECGAYFFCPTEHTSCDDIRRWMGNFDHIRIVAKYAARMGQCFSTTREIRGIYKPTTRRIPDVERNGYCFTDGVGIISEFLARVIIDEMQLDIMENPTAFQFRMGGSKGVLVVWPQAAKGMDVMVRESQEKFKAEFNGLEIIRCARRSTATLNRQTIPILECLGVPVKSFTDLLDKQIREYQHAMEDDAVAIGLLTKYVDEAQNTLVLAEMLKADFNGKDTRELFIVNLLNLWRSWTLRLLKEKARIQVENSAFVLGCVDETGTLRGHSTATEGAPGKDISALPQIFLQLTDPTQCDKMFVVSGVCLVGRNPSLHPGDIRVVEAVDNPQLRHLKDVIVFPSTGDRPVPNMLSGGDLDGDDFFCIWDPSLLPSEWNFPPMNYTGLKPEELSEPVQVDDIRTFFVKYMKNDVLGLIASAHVGHADEQGPKSQLCQLLAEEHSKAVDYPKTGQPAEFSQKLQPKKWPHFMEKKGQSYRSRKALGVIFDKVATQAVKFRPDWEHAFDQRVLTKFELDDDTLEEARRIKSEYDMCVRRVLTQHAVATEFELFTSWAMSAPPVGSDYKRQEQLSSEFDALKTRFREMCYEAAGGSDAKRLDRFVAAMYRVTEQEMKAALDKHRQREKGEMEENGEAETDADADGSQPKSMPLISFPWIFYLAMIRIATGREPRLRKSRLGVVRGEPQTMTAAVDAGKTTAVANTSDAAGVAEAPASTAVAAAFMTDDDDLMAAELWPALASTKAALSTGPGSGASATDVQGNKESDDDDLVQLLDGDEREATRLDGEADLFSADDYSDEEPEQEKQQSRLAAFFGFSNEDA
ncbi:hypothetical protein XA68_17243 [Ophiocordyceps unilateralis]|uniref:RNA-dependent RNA polymerase n=1 Tax=Ophiocordyceps unilateralis TaxID=268505 RepID=A0A2A9P531_OPHUN|nr:hypothetical protein XA68_17243 [Ophiocordyceps unilateralis]